MSGNCKYGLRVEGKDIEVPLKESKIQVTVQEFIANVECQLTYVNEGPDPLQTSFVFPMDDMSAVYKFEAHVNKKHIIAECQDKEKAKKTYDEAIASGHTAMLLSEDDTAGDIFECKIGNLPAGETALLTMGFIAELSVEPEGKMRFTLPTVLNPRYFPEVGHLLEAGSAPSPGQVNIKTPCKLIFSSSVSGRHKINAVTSSNDKFNVTISDDKLSAVIELTEEFKFDHDLSLDIVYDDITKPEVILELGDPKKDGLLKEDVLMLNLYPDLKQGEEMEDSKREFIFVIDRSGSMNGHRIQRAKETLLLLLKSLPVKCFFNVVSFGNSHSSLFDQSQEYSEYTLQQAIDLQKTMDSNMGGTEILEPLKSIYSNSCKQGYPRQIFLLTDGEVGNTHDVVSLVRKNNGNTRVFTFGIGDGVSTSLIKNVAKASNGKAIFIKDKDNMQAKVIETMKGSLKCCLSEIQLHWDIPKCFSVIDIPSEPPVVFHREKLVLFALLRSKDNKKGVTGKLNLKGTFGGKTVSYSATIETPSSSHPDLPLHRMAAKYQIKDLEINDEGSYHRDGVNKDRIILVSQAANIVSKYTAFVGVDKDTKVPVSTIKEKPKSVRSRIDHLFSSLCGPFMKTKEIPGVARKRAKGRTGGSKGHKKYKVSGEQEQEQGVARKRAKGRTGGSKGHKKYKVSGEQEQEQGVARKRAKGRTGGSKGHKKYKVSGEQEQEQGVARKRAKGRTGGSKGHKKYKVSGEQEQEQGVARKRAKGRTGGSKGHKKYKVSGEQEQEQGVARKRAKGRTGGSKGHKVSGEEEQGVARKRAKGRTGGSKGHKKYKVSGEQEQEQGVARKRAKGRTGGSKGHKKYKVSGEQEQEQFDWRSVMKRSRLSGPDEMCGDRSSRSMCARSSEPDCCVPTCFDEVRIENGDKDIMMKIVSLQNFDGSWSPSKELKKILQINEKEQKTHFKDKIWCTATVLVFLEKNFSQHLTEWEMIKNKAIKWMTSQNRDGKTVGEILQEVKESV